MEDGRSMTITSTEFTPEDVARIPKRLRGIPFVLHDGLETLSTDEEGDDDETLEGFGEKEREFQACNNEKLDRLLVYNLTSTSVVKTPTR
uniref:Uncharacterized protein n=1 Tax=Oryza punctata TaxID=4537 RepID=A0A0E0LYN6_ORYPU